VFQVLRELTAPRAPGPRCGARPAREGVRAAAALCSGDPEWGTREAWASWSRSRARPWRRCRIGTTSRWSRRYPSSGDSS